MGTVKKVNNLTPKSCTINKISRGDKHTLLFVFLDCFWGVRVQKFLWLLTKVNPRSTKGGHCDPPPALKRRKITQKASRYLQVHPLRSF